MESAKNAKLKCRVKKERNKPTRKNERERPKAEVI
jgi:hypothetical protein